MVEFVLGCVLGKVIQERIEGNLERIKNESLEMCWVMIVKLQFGLIEREIQRSSCKNKDYDINGRCSRGMIGKVC